MKTKKCNYQHIVIVCVMTKGYWRPLMCNREAYFKGAASASSLLAKATWQNTELSPTLSWGLWLLLLFF
jgi:hypothetical protein